MSLNPGLAERIAFGRPLAAEDDPIVHAVPRPATALVGRFLLAAMFLVSGIAKLVDVAGTAGHMTAMGVPEAETLAVIAGIAEIAGAASIAFGFLARIGAIGMILFLIITTFVFHAFWNYEGQEQVMQMAQFFKNLAYMGGLTLLIAYGPGRYSIDSAIRRPQEA